MPSEDGSEDPLDALSHEQKAALAGFIEENTNEDGEVELHSNPTFSRRDVMKVGGGVGLGALLGGGSLAATQSSSADPSTSDSDGNVGTPSDPVDAWIEGLGGPSGGPVDVDTGLVPTADATHDLGSSSNSWNNAHVSSLSAAESNKTYHVPDGVSDLGARLNQYDSEVPEGSIIHIPRGDWDWSTTFTPSKNLILVGDHILADTLNLGTVAQRQSDVKLIEPDDGVGIAIDAIEFRDMVSGSTTGVELHGTSWLRDVTFHSFGDALYLHSNASASNLNETVIERLRLVGLRGDGVKIENTGGAVDVNALDIHIRAATGVDGAVVNQLDGWGIKVHANLVESIGPSDSGTVFDINGTNSEWEIVYAENTGTLFEFSNDYNHATFSQTVGVDARTNGGGDNIIHAKGSSDEFYQTTLGRLSFASPIESTRVDWTFDSPENTRELTRLVYPDASRNPSERGTYTSGVGTSATAIHDTDKTVGVVYVLGRSGGDYFADEVVYESADGSENDRELITRGTPAGRTYSVDASNDDLTLTLDSGSCDVIAKSAIEGLPGTP